MKLHMLLRYNIQTINRLTCWLFIYLVINFKVIHIDFSSHETMHFQKCLSLRGIFGIVIWRLGFKSHWSTSNLYPLEYCQVKHSPLWHKNKLFQIIVRKTFYNYVILVSIGWLIVNIDAKIPHSKIGLVRLKNSFFY